MSRVAVIHATQSNLAKVIETRLTEDGYRVVVVDALSEDITEVTIRNEDVRSVHVLVNVIALHDAHRNSASPGSDPFAASVELFRRGAASVIPIMLARKSGVIVNIASIEDPVPATARTDVAQKKAAVLGLTRGLALELGPHQIRVVSLSHGILETLDSRQDDDLSTLERREAAIKQRIPIGRVVPLQDVAALCSFIASDKASFITGCDLLVDGGASALNKVFSYNP